MFASTWVDVDALAAHEWGENGQRQRWPVSKVANKVAVTVLVLVEKWLMLEKVGVGFFSFSMLTIAIGIA